MASIGWIGPRLTFAVLLPVRAEKYQQHRQGQRAGERQVAELDESSLAEIDKRKACHQDKAQYGSFGEPLNKRLSRNGSGWLRRPRNQWRSASVRSP